LALGTLVEDDEWARHVERQRISLDDLVIQAFVARVPLLEGWERVVDPAVATWLGFDVPGTDARFRDLALLSYGGRMSHHRGWEDTARTLAVGKFDSVLSSTGKSAADFKPGKFFKDDGRKLARYLACAMKYGGTVEDVEPAWFDFLSRRSPATTPRIEAGDL